MNESHCIGVEFDENLLFFYDFQNKKNKYKKKFKFIELFRFAFFICFLPFFKVFLSFKFYSEI